MMDLPDNQQPLSSFMDMTKLIQQASLADTFDEQIYLTKIFSNLQGVPIMVLLVFILFLILRDFKSANIVSGVIQEYLKLCYFISF